MKLREIQERAKQPMTLAELRRFQSDVAAFQAQCWRRAAVGIGIALAGCLLSLMAVLIGAVAR